MAALGVPAPDPAARARELADAAAGRGSTVARAAAHRGGEPDRRRRGGAADASTRWPGRAHLVGITGAPGAGKSTLVSALIAEVRARGRTVGVIAVDPSSPITGGALLGDRVRMQAYASDRDVFIRSMASRGHAGGLASTSAAAAAVLDACGFDLVLLETVGTGQSEVEVAAAADTTVVLEAPEMGDEVQAIKAGLLEVADIVVVNKGDRPGAQRTASQLRAMLVAVARVGAADAAATARETRPHRAPWLQRPSRRRDRRRARTPPPEAARGPRHDRDHRGGDPRAPRLARPASRRRARVVRGGVAAGSRGGAGLGDPGRPDPGGARRAGAPRRDRGGPPCRRRPRPRSLRRRGPAPREPAPVTGASGSALPGRRSPQTSACSRPPSWRSPHRSSASSSRAACSCPRLRASRRARSAATPSRSGLVVGSFSVSSLLLRPFAGRWADRRGRRIMLIAGAVLQVAAAAGHLVADSIALLVMMRLLLGASEAVFFVGGMAAATDLAPERRRGEAISLISTSLYLGVAIGPILAEWLYGTSGYAAIWIVATAISIAAVVLSWFARRPCPRPRDELPDAEGGLLHRRGIVPGLLVLCGAWGMGAYFAFLPLLGDDLGLDGVGGYLAAFALVVIGLRIFGARLPDRFGAARLSGTALVLSASGMAIAGFFPSEIGLWVATFVFATGVAFTFPAIVALSVIGVPPAERGAVVGTTSLFLDVAFGLSPALLGLLAGPAGYPATFLVSGVIAAVGAAWLLLRGGSLAQAAGVAPA